MRHAATAVLFVYLGSFPLFAPRPARAQPHCIDDTGQNATVLVPETLTIDLAPLTLDAGDVLTVQTGDRACVGKLTWTPGQPQVLTVWGDDEMTEAVDGLRPNETLHVWLYDAATASYTSLGVTFDDAAAYYRADGVYQPDAIYALQTLRVRGTSTADGPGSTLPTRFTLETNYPNPFNPTTTIRYGLPEAAPVRLAVFDTVGRRVALLVDGPQEPGYHTVTFEAAGLPSGLYLYRLQAGSFDQTQAMVLLK